MSSRALRGTLIVLAVVGIGLASYLTYVHYSGEIVLCSTAHNTCEQVQTSIYSKVAGVPVALMGLIGYVLIFASLLAPEGETSRFATAGLTLGGFGFSAYLTYREVFSLHKICEWCVGSATLLTIMMCLSVWRFLRSSGAGVPPPTLEPPASGGPRGASAGADEDHELAAEPQPSA